MSDSLSDSLGEFSNNLASDLGPLLVLFGERMTIQYLSECTTTEDYIIFATAPIGIITALVSAIRICGGTYLRAFIGRAQEGAAAAEVELCTSTGRDVCELFTRGGITRSLGKPSILELVYVQPASGSSSPSAPDPKNLHIYRKYLKRLGDERWPKKTRDIKAGQRKDFGRKLLEKVQSRLKDPEGDPLPMPKENGAAEPEPDTDLPNLSLNVGIVKPHRCVFWVVAAIGIVLQTGVLALAVLGVVGLLAENESATEDATVDRSLLRDTLLFIIGTVLMCSGMGACAALIGRTTREFVDTKRKPEQERLLWLQPGNQKIGDQSFGSYVIFETEDHPVTRYMISTMDDKRREKMHVHTAFAAATTLVGFITQFIGIRGLSTWVSLAQLIITIVMSLLRGLVRMQRRGKEDNELKSYDDGVHGHELDWLAFNLACDDCSRHRYSQDSSNSTSEPQTHRVYSFQVTGKIVVLPRDEKGAHGAKIASEPEHKQQPQDEIRALGHFETCTADTKTVAVSDGVCGPAIVESSQQYHAAPDPKTVFEMRVRLAKLTGNVPASALQKDHMNGQHQAWESKLVSCREKALQISNAVCDAAAVLFPDATQRKSLQLQVAISKLEVDTNTHQTVSVNLEAPLGTTSTAWTIDTAAIEALLGLWVWSINEPKVHTPESRRSTGSDEITQPSIAARIVFTGEGDNNWGRRTYAETELWMLLGSDTPTLKTTRVRIDPQSEYGIVNMWPSSDGSNDGDGGTWQHAPSLYVDPFQGRRVFGWQRADSSVRELGAEKRTYTIRYVDVTASTFDICAQEIYTALVASLASSATFGGLDLAFTSKGADRRLVSDGLSTIRASFVEHGLGTTSDAVLCLLSAFREKLRINPSQQDILEIVLECLTTTDWKPMDLFLRWAVVAFEGDDLNRVIRAAAEFYRRGMVEQGWLEFCSKGIQWLASKAPSSFLGDHGIITGYNALIRKVQEKGLPTFSSTKFCNLVDDTYHSGETDQSEIMSTALYLLCAPVSLQEPETESMSGSPSNDQEMDRARLVRLIYAFEMSLTKAAQNPGTLWSSISLALAWAFNNPMFCAHLDPDYRRGLLAMGRQKGASSICHAVDLDDYDLVYLLRRLGPDHEPGDRYTNWLAAGSLKNGRPLLRAASKGNLRMIHLLLPSGTPEEKEIFAYQQLLLGSAWTRDMPTLESAVAALRHRNGEIDKKDEHGQTALSISARCGHSTGVKYLLALGRAVVHPATQDNAGRTPLSWALREYSQNVRNYLEDPEGTRRYLWDATGSLVEKGKVKEYDAVVEALAYNDRHVKNLSIADSEGKKILHLAALTGSAKLTKEVCKALGSPPQNDQFDSDHRTPLSFAAMHGHAEVVRYLLPDTRQRNALDRGGRTALHLAASCGTGAAAVEALLEAVNINPNVRDPEGKTPLMLAARSPVQESAKVATVKALLKRKDVRVSFVDNLGRTALSYAAETGSPKTVELLMERCSVKDLNAEDYAPWTPLCWAIQSYSLGDLEVISLMLRDKRVVVPDPNLESCHGTKLAIDEVADEDIDGSDELHPTHRPHIRWTSVFLLWMGVWRTWEDDDGHRHWDRVENPQIPPPEIVNKYIEDSRRLFDSSDIEDRGSGEL